MRIVVLTLISVLAEAQLFAQAWRSELYPNDWSPPTEAVDFYEDAFLQDFSYAGYHRGVDSIPDVRAGLIDVTAAPYSADNTGATDATAAIQSAIDAAEAAGGGVVYLPPGTYAVSLPAGEDAALRISASNIVLRGAGTEATFLYCTTTVLRQKQIIQVEPEGGSNWDVTPADGELSLITRDLRGPTMTIPLDNPRRFAVGDEVIVRALMTNDWVREHNEDPEWLDQELRLDNVIHFRNVTAVTDTSITIDAPTRYSLLTRDRAMVYSAAQSNMIREVGLEDFSIGNKEIVTARPQDWLDPDQTLNNNGYREEGEPAYGLHASSAIKLRCVRDAWVRNVSSYAHPDNAFGTHILSNGVKLEYAAMLTLDKVRMANPQYGGGGGNGYLFRIESNDALLRNCTAVASRHGYSVVRIWSHGNVLLNCLDSLTGKATANGLPTGPGYVKTGSSGSDFHQWFSPSNLVDGMRLYESYFSAVHRLGIGSGPPHNAVTAHSPLWNVHATDAPQGYCVRTSQTRTGYVIGTAGNTPAVNNRPDQFQNFLTRLPGIAPAFRYDRDGARTMPFDFVEGEGRGADLSPVSLYVDQRARRLGLPFATSVAPTSGAGTVEVYPNPSGDGRFRLRPGGAWRVFTLTGKLVTRGEGELIDLSSQAAGVYVLSAHGKTLKLIR